MTPLELSVAFAPLPATTLFVAAIATNPAALAIAAIAPTAAVLLGWFLNRKLKVIHVLVNDRLDTALDKIERLEAALDLEPGEEPLLEDDEVA